MGLPVAVCVGLRVAAAVAQLEPLSSSAGLVRVFEPAPLVPGEAGEVSVTILESPLRGAPIQVRLDASEVGLPENRLGLADVVDPKADQPRLAGRVVAPERPGLYLVHGEIRYVTCPPDEGCRPRRADVHWVVTVVEAAEAPPS